MQMYRETESKKKMRAHILCIKPKNFNSLVHDSKIKTQNSIVRMEQGEMFRRLSFMITPKSKTGVKKITTASELSMQNTGYIRNVSAMPQKEPQNQCASFFFGNDGK